MLNKLIKKFFVKQEENTALKVDWFFNGYGRVTGSSEYIPAVGEYVRCPGLPDKLYSVTSISNNLVPTFGYLHHVSSVQIESVQIILDPVPNGY